MPSAALDREDIDRLARLQERILPGSALSRLGLHYLRSFFAYVERSPHELCLVERNRSGAIVAACVVSTSMSSLPRRLLRNTTLLIEAARHPRWLVDTLVHGGGRAGAEESELLLLFTNEAERGHGHGTQLIARAETELFRRGVDRYVVRTFDDPDDPALAFYLARGFNTVTTFQAFGRSFRLLTKQISNQ